MSIVQGVSSRIQGEPSYSAGAVMAVINLLVVFNVMSLTADQLSAINTVVAAVLAVVVRRAVTPLSGTPIHRVMRTPSGSGDTPEARRGI